MSLTNRQLIEAYVTDPDPDFNKGVRRANSLFCHGGVLHSYAEPIARYQGGTFLVTASYEHTAPFVSNIYFLVAFDKTVEIQAR